MFNWWEKALSEEYIKWKKVVFENLREATTACFVKSEAYDTVLLSPACASWDQYDSFESRGKEFKEIVKELGSE